MPSRQEMIDDILKAQNPSAPAGVGSQITPSRDEMIKDILSAQQAQPKQPSFGEQVGNSFETTGRSALEAMTLGLSEPVISGTNALINQGYRAIAGDDKPENQFTIDNLKKAYDEDVDRRRQMKHDYAINDVGGSIVGAFVPGTPGAFVAAEGAGKAGKVAETLGNSARTAANALGVGKLADNALVNAAGKIAKGYAEGAGGSVASELVRQNIEKPTGFIKDGEDPSMTDVAMTGGKWGAGIASIPVGWQATKWLAKRGMSVALGPRVETIDKYMAAADRINNARSEDDLKTQLNDIGKNLEQDVADGTITKQEAAQYQKSVEDRVNQLRTESRMEFGRRTYQAQKDLESSERALSNKVAGQKEALKAVRAPIDLADDVGQSIAHLKDQVQKGSSEAYEILEKDPGAYSVRGAAPILRKIADDMNIQSFEAAPPGAQGALVSGTQWAPPKGAASRPVTSQSIGVQNELRSFADLLEQTPQRVPARELKKILQQIDNSEKAIYGQPGFDSRISQAYKMVRGVIDDAVKANNPEYREKMKEVAEKTGLLNQAVDSLGTQQGRINALNSIAGNTKGPIRDLLQQLSDHTDGRYMEDIQSFVDAQNTLKNPRKLETMAAQSPEYADAAAKRAQLESMKHPDAGRQFVEDQLALSGLPDEQRFAEKRLTDAEEKLAQAKAQQKDLGLNATNGEALVNQIMREKSPLNARNKIANIDEKMGTNLAQEIDDRRVLDSFSKGNTNGSRNVNLFSVMGHSVGAAMSVAGGLGAVLGGPTGMFVGSVAGAVVDKYGPQMAKGILDAVLKIEGTPSVQKIQQLNLPPDVKSYLNAQLVKHQVETIRAGEFRHVGKHDELDNDSSVPTNYRVPDEEAKRRFLEGN